MTADRSHRVLSSRRVMILIALPFVFQILLLVTLAVIERVGEAERRAELGSRETIASAYRLLGLLVDAETSVRGYVISGRPVFLEPYNHTLGAFPAELKHLRDVSETSSSGVSVDNIEDASRNSLEYLSRIVRMSATGRGSEATQIVSAGVGKTLTDRVRSLMGSFLKEQRALDARREETAARLRRHLLSTMLVAFLINVIVGFASAWVFRKAITKRLAVLVENTARLSSGEALLEPLGGADELSELDRHFHAMAEAINTGRERLEAANREMESFTYSVSHDLRAPLRAVSGYAQMVEEDFAAQLNDEGRRFLTTIRSEAKRMGKLIDDLLEFSRLNRKPMATGVVDISAMAKDVFREVTALRPELTSTLACTDLPPAQADGSMIRQVLFNLISNAVKFSSGSSAPIVEVGAEPGPVLNRYWVRDHGAGFDMKYVGKLFGVFQRLHTADEFEGTGVGLAIVHSVVTRHGGKVWAEGAIGKGATFFFTLPAAQLNAGRQVA